MNKYKTSDFSTFVFVFFLMYLKGKERNDIILFSKKLFQDDRHERLM